jgi:hypothetical protein
VRRGTGALENRCPHQGGPLGEGSIENGWLRCPWHGYDYDPLVPTISRSTPNTVQLSPGWFWTAGLPRASYLLVRCQ